MLLGSPAPAFQIRRDSAFPGYWRGTVAEMNESLQGSPSLARRGSDSVPARGTRREAGAAQRRDGGHRPGDRREARRRRREARAQLAPRGGARGDRQGLPGGARKHDVIVSDLAEAGAAEKLIGQAGDVDVLIANAALPASGLLDDFSPNEIQRALRVNLEAPILMSRELGPALAKKGEGHIVMVASLSGKVGLSPGVPLQRDEVRPARVRLRLPRGHASARRRCLHRLAGLRARGRDVPRLGGEAAAGGRDDDTGEGAPRRSRR